MRIFKTHSLSSFLICNTVLFTAVTMLYITSPKNVLGGKFCCVYFTNILKTKQKRRYSILNTHGFLGFYILLSSMSLRLFKRIVSAPWKHREMGCYSVSLSSL